MPSPSDAPRSRPLTADALLQLRGTVRANAERRADLAWKGVLAHLRERTEHGARELVTVCESPAVLARVQARIRGEVSWHTPANESDADACVERLALAWLLARLRAAMPASVEVLGPGVPSTAGEARAVELVRRHRLEVRTSFAAVKVALWEAVAVSALREADALATAFRTSCRAEALDGLRAALAETIRATPRIAGEHLPLFAERVAAERLLTVLGPMLGRSRRASRSGSRQRAPAHAASGVASVA